MISDLSTVAYEYATSLVAESPSGLTAGSVLELVSTLFLLLLCRQGCDPCLHLALYPSWPTAQISCPWKSTRPHPCPNGWKGAADALQHFGFAQQPDFRFRRLFVNYRHRHDPFCASLTDQSDAPDRSFKASLCEGSRRTAYAVGARDHGNHYSHRRGVNTNHQSVGVEQT